MSNNNNENKYDCPARLLGDLYYNSYHYYPETKACREFLVGMFKDLNNTLRGIDAKLFNIASRGWDTIIQDSLAIFHDVRFLLEKFRDFETQVYDNDFYLEDMERHWKNWQAKMEERQAAKEAKQKTEAEEGDAVVGVKPVNVEAKGGNAT